MALSICEYLTKPKLFFVIVMRYYQKSIAHVSLNSTIPDYLDFKVEVQALDESYITKVVGNFVLHKDFISVEEENSILAEIEPHLKRMRYQFDHWDDAIHGYRETERFKWNSGNVKILDRVRDLAFPKDGTTQKLVHVLDLDKNGYIKPHIDAVRFCGNTIAGLSLCSDSVMRLKQANGSEGVCFDVLLPRRSLYIMKDLVRYDFTHEILSNEHSTFKENHIAKERRISVICRNEPQ